MALLFSDGFDSYAATADLRRYWGQPTSPWAWSAGADQNGATGGIISANAVAGAGMFFPARFLNGALLVGFGYWMKLSALPAGIVDIFYVYDTNYTPTFRLRIGTDGFLRYCDENTGVIATGNINVADNVWHWIEFFCRAGGNVNQRLMVDTTSQFNGNGNLAGITRGFWSATFVSMVAGLYSVSDVLVYNNYGTDLNPAFQFPLGPRKIITRRPDGDDVVAFTRSTGTTNYTLLDEVNADAADYVESAADTTQDTYDYAALGSTPSSVTAVVVKAAVQAAGAGAPGFKLLAKSGGIVSEGVKRLVPPSPLNIIAPFYVDPNGGAAWTETTINAAKFGIKVWNGVDPAVGDPYFTSVKLLVTGVGANGATSFPDLSPFSVGNGTLTGDTKLSNTTPITGNATSLYCDGTGDDVRWSLPLTGGASIPFTYEMLWKPAGAGSVIGWGQDWSGIGTYGGFVQALADGSFRCFGIMGNPVYDFSTAAGQWAAGNEYFFCLENSGSKMRLYLGLMSGGTFTMIGNLVTANDKTFGTPFRFGSYGYAGPHAGRANHLRFTDNVARYNSDSGGTIPTTPFPNY